MDRPPSSLNVLEVLVSQVLLLEQVRQLLDVLRPRRGGHGDHAALDRPLKEDIADVGALALRDPFQHRPERAAGVTDDGRERPVPLSDNVVLAVQREDGLEVNQNVRVVLEFWPVQLGRSCRRTVANRVDCGHLEDLLDVLGTEVAEAKGTALERAVLHQSLQVRPELSNASGLGDKWVVN